MTGRTATFDPARPLVQAALTRLESALGGRDALVETLAAAPSTEQLSYVVGLVADPRHVSKTLGELCDLGNITPDQLLAAYRSGKAARAQALAYAAVYDRIPEVAADLMRRATVHLVQCETCKGRGTTKRAETRVDSGVTRKEWTTETCQVCDGLGELEQEPTLATQELALTIGGLVPKAGGAHLSVAVGVDARQLAPDASYSEVQKALAKLLAPPPLTLDTTAIPAAVPPAVPAEVPK